MPSTHHRTGPIVRRLIVVLGLAGIVVALSAPAFAAAVPPKLSNTDATFAIPTGSTSTFTLNLWWEGHMKGSDSGTSGTLTVPVPFESSACTFQADVTQTVGGKTTFYSGLRKTLQSPCGTPPPPTSTIAGDIFLCSASGTPTTTEVTLGTLAVTGTSLSQGSPLPPTTIASGTYTMTATAPSGYNFVSCGGSAVPDSSGLTATDTGIVVPSGGAGVGNFYVVAVTPAGGVGSSGPPSSPGSGPTAPSSSPGNSGPAKTVKAPATQVSSSHLAFTGMNTEPLLLTGLILLGLGMLASLLARVRRRSSHTQL
jgi:hypothetical protein